MKVVVKSKFVGGVEHEEIVERLRDSSYAMVETTIESCASAIGRAIADSLGDNGVQVKTVRIKMDRNPSPTLAEVKTEYEFTVTVEGEPVDIGR